MNKQTPPPPDDPWAPGVLASDVPIVDGAEGFDGDPRQVRVARDNSPPADGAGNDAVQLSPTDAVRFLAALDPQAKSFTFQTFDDDPSRKVDTLACIKHGSLIQLWPKLVQLNNRGAGIFVTVNATDLKGRKTENVIKVRALFVDLDGARLDPVTACSTPPHIVVESSPGRWHCYWLVSDVPLDQFETLQRRLAARFSGDTSVYDLPRVLRLPGFVHQKGAPFLSALQAVDVQRPQYTLQQVLDAFPPPSASEAEEGQEKLSRTNGQDHQRRRHKHYREDDPGPVKLDKIKAALEVIDSGPYETWLRVGGALYHELGEYGFGVFDKWSAQSPKYQPEECKEKWRNIRDLTEFTAGTIFYLADQADPSWRDRYHEEVRRNWYDHLRDAHRASTGGDAAGANAGASGSAGTAGAGTAPPNPPLMSATLYVWIDPANIPMRDWLYGRLLIRKFVTATVAPGGLGKSSLITAEALSQVSGKEILGVTPKGQLRVWLWNLEDPQEETQRKIQAAAKRYGLKAEDLGNRLFVDSGRDRPLVIATMTRDGPAIVRPVVDALVAEIIDKQIDILIVDPFVSCHELPENDNTAQDMVIKEWGRIAERGNCAVHLVDHTRKMGSLESEVTAESSGGAKAKTDAARVVRVVNRMSKDDGDKAGVKNHRLHFRTYSDKANLAPPADKSDWFELKSVDLGNGPGMEIGGVKLDGPGDSVGVVQVWQWPDPLAGMTGADFDKGGRCHQAGEMARERASQGMGWPCGSGGVGVGCR